MKTLKFALLFSILFTGYGALADTTIPWTKAGCESVQGTWVTANSATDSGCDANHCNGLSFCRNSQKLNWFSALTWCKSIGHQLADLETACPNGLASSRTCANLNGCISPIKSNWVSTPGSSGSNQYYVEGNTIKTGGNLWTLYALCTEQNFLHTTYCSRKTFYNSL